MAHRIPEVMRFGVDDYARAAKILEGIKGKRLTYRDLTKSTTLWQQARRFKKWRNAGKR